jgi:hypothetical protein
MGVFSARAAEISTPVFFVAAGLLLAKRLSLEQIEPDLT